MGAEANPISTKKLAIGGILLGLLLLRLATPLLQAKTQILAKAAKLEEEIKQTKSDALTYDKSWQDRMTKKEATMRTEIPDTLNSADVLDYFLTEFEKSHPNKIRFLSVNHQAGSSSGLRLGKQRNAPSGRISRYKIAAEITQDAVVDYLEHIEKYQSYFTVDSFSLNVPPKGGPYLNMDLQLDFYLQPIEWVPKEALVGQLEPEVDLDSKKNAEHWFQIYVSAPTRGLSSPEGGFDIVPHFKITESVGTSVVVNETLYEEGDLVRGWKLMRVEQSTKTAVFKRGGRTWRTSIP